MGVDTELGWTAQGGRAGRVGGRRIYKGTEEKQVTLRSVWLGEMGNRASVWLPGALNAKLNHVDFVLGW